MTEQMVLNESEIESLLEIADGNQKERSFSEPQAGHVTASPISCLLESRRRTFWSHRTNGGCRLASGRNRLRGLLRDAPLRNEVRAQAALCILDALCKLIEFCDSPLDEREYFGVIPPPAHVDTRSRINPWE